MPKIRIPKTEKVSAEIKSTAKKRNPIANLKHWAHPAKTTKSSKPKKGGY